MYTATISSKFQISVPKKVRDALHIKPGQQFIFIVKGGCLELVPKRDLHDLKGIMIGANTKNIRDRGERI